MLQNGCIILDISATNVLCTNVVVIMVNNVFMVFFVIRKGRRAQIYITMHVVHRKYSINSEAYASELIEHLEKNVYIVS